MATSRTGTAAYKQWRAKVLHQAQQDGITHCPRCRVLLDYTTGMRPNGATADHIIPWSKGGQNHVENGAVLCRYCNISIGNKQGKRPRQRVETIDFEEQEM